MAHFGGTTYGIRLTLNSRPGAERFSPVYFGLGEFDEEGNGRVVNAEAPEDAKQINAFVERVGREFVAQALRRARESEGEE